MNRWYIPDPALYAMLFGSLSGIMTGMLIFKIGYEATGQNWLPIVGVAAAAVFLIPLAISGIIAYSKEAGRKRAGMEKIVLALHCISCSGSIAAITLITEGAHSETGVRLAHAALLLWMSTTIIHLAHDNIRNRNGNDENRDGYASRGQTKPDAEHKKQ